MSHRKQSLPPAFVALASSLVLSVIFAVGGPASSQASLVRALDLAQMTTQSDAVVVGEVLEVTSAWDKDRKRILTTVDVSVAEQWKGTGPGRIKVVVLGGSVGDIEMRVHGMPQFQVGERAVLFLVGRGPSTTLLALGQGRRPLQFDTPSSRWMVAPGDRSAAVTLDRGQFKPAPADDRVPLDDLRRKVRALVAQ